VDANVLTGEPRKRSKTMKRSMVVKAIGSVSFAAGLALALPAGAQIGVGIMYG
jgi:hypothetical protein